MGLLWVPLKAVARPPPSLTVGAWLFTLDFARESSSLPTEPPKREIGFVLHIEVVVVDRDALRQIPTPSPSHSPSKRVSLLVHLLDLAFLFSGVSLKQRQ